MTDGDQTVTHAEDAAVPVSSAPHIVHLACRCPGEPHGYDVVTLRREPSNRMGIAYAAALNYFGTDVIRLESELGLVFLRFGIEAWSFDDRGPVPCETPVAEALIDRWLPWANGGSIVAEAANGLYATALMRPFVERSRTRSPAGPTGPLTSATTDSGATRPRRSKRSSHLHTVGKPSGA